jgi:hypothetical protein
VRPVGLEAAIASSQEDRDVIRVLVRHREIAILVAIEVTDGNRAWPCANRHVDSAAERPVASTEND